MIRRKRRSRTNSRRLRSVSHNLVTSFTNINQNWLYEDGEDASKAQYIAKMDEIKFVAGVVVGRYNDKVEEERQARMKVEEEAAAKKRADLEAKRKADEEAKKAADAEKKSSGTETPKTEDTEMKDAEPVKADGAEQAK